MAVLSTCGQGLVVNPELLLADVRKAFTDLYAGIDGNRRKLLSDNLRRRFEPQVNLTSPKKT
jgi:hypothetical protein